MSLLRLHAEKELCRVQAIKSLNNGRLGNALDWALRSQDNLHVTSIADLILKVRCSYSMLFYHFIDTSEHYPCLHHSHRQCRIIFTALHENRYRSV